MLMHELAARLGATVTTPVREQALQALAAPETAGPADLSFDLSGLIPRRGCATTRAAAVMRTVQDHDPRTVVVDDVVRACARVSAWLPVRRARVGAAGAQHDRIHPSAHIAPSAVIGEGVSIGEQTTIEAGVTLAAGVRVGAFSRIGAYTVIEACSEIGNRVSIGSACAIGEDGFAFVADGEKWLRVPCFGAVTIGDDCALLAHVIVHAGVFSDTVIEAGCALDSQVLIGHDSKIGRDTAIAGQTAVAGAARLGRGCKIGGKVGIGEGVVVADGITITAMSMVTRSLDGAHGSYSSAWPVERSTRWWRRVSRLMSQADGQPMPGVTRVNGNEG